MTARPFRRGLLALGAAVLTLCVASGAGATGFAGTPWLTLPGLDGGFGLRTPLRVTLPGVGTPFSSELSTLSWNALVALSLGAQPGTLPGPTPGTPLSFPLVALNQDPGSIPLRPPGCGFLNPSGCSSVQDFLYPLDLRAGGNGQFGRNDFGIWTPIVGIEPITIRNLICSTSVGVSNPTVCERPSAAVPEPSAALVFAVGLAVAAVRRRR